MPRYLVQVRVREIILPPKGKRQGWYRSKRHWVVVEASSAAQASYRGWDRFYVGMLERVVRITHLGEATCPFLRYSSIQGAHERSHS